MSEYIECAKNYRGYKESEEVSEWFSTILGVDCFLMRAAHNRLSYIDKDRFEGSRPNDRRAGFLTDGAIHLINNQSCQDLIMSMYKKY